MKTPLDSRASCQTERADSISLTVHGLVPSFKNCKRAVVQKGLSKKGKPYARPVTEPEVKKRMESITRSIASQLLSICQTDDGATSRACSRRSLTALLPRDDCWEIIPEQHIYGKLCANGEERVEIKIERI